MSWAITAFDHAETHMSLLKVVPDATTLKLSPIDDEIYDRYLKSFPDLKIADLVEDMIKSDDQKKVRLD